MFTVSALSCHLRGRAPLEQLSFTVATAEKVALLGRRFSGVSTLQEILCGYLRPETGSVRVGPYDLGRESSEARRLIGFVPAAAPVYPELQLGRYLELCAELRELTQPTQAAGEIAARCGLKPLLHKKIGKLSAGSLQLINIAQALIHDPVLVLLDDPLRPLDAAERSWLLDLIKDLTTYKSLLFTSHSLDLVPRLCQRVLMLRAGRLSFDAALDASLSTAQLEALFVRHTQPEEAER